MMIQRISHTSMVSTALPVKQQVLSPVIFRSSTKKAGSQSHAYLEPPLGGVAQALPVELAPVELSHFECDAGQ